MFLSAFFFNEILGYKILFNTLYSHFDPKKGRIQVEKKDRIGELKIKRNTFSITHLRKTV